MLRPKGDGRTAHFYTVVARDTVDADFAAHRQRFLAEQGYAYRIVDADDLLRPLTHGFPASTADVRGERVRATPSKLPGILSTLSSVTAEPATAEASLLVVEDEPNIRELLATSLRFAGFEVSVADDGALGHHQRAERNPDLVVLDVMLPDMDGFEVTRRLRESGRQLPIVFVTARDSVDDKIKGLTVGGDDYVTKPFSLEEVVARIRAVLRRTRGDESSDARRSRFHDLELDEDSHEVRRGGRVIEVSPTEFKLLRYLMLNPNRVLSKAQILDHVWDYDFRGESRHRRVLHLLPAPQDRHRRARR